jgi:hypothetical protein
LTARIRIVRIKDYESIIFHINEFNKYFYRFGIQVEESEVKVECLGELPSMYESIASFNRRGTFPSAIIKSKPRIFFLLSYISFSDSTIFLIRALTCGYF